MDQNKQHIEWYLNRWCNLLGKMWMLKVMLVTIYETFENF